MTRDYDPVLREEIQRRRDILSYGHAVATERATYAAACAWHAFSDQYRAKMDNMHPADAVGLGRAIQDARQAAEDAHRDAEAALREVPFHFRLFDPNYIRRNLPDPD